VTDDDRRRLSAFVLNKFRGDEGLLAPAPVDLEHATGMRYAGLLPYVDHGLPDEDSAAVPAQRPDTSRVAAIRYPTASNLDELKPLEQVAQVVWASDPDDLDGAELVILPGSKNVSADLAWLRVRGLAHEVRAAARRGTRVLGICGGLQMLGEEIRDPAGVDGDAFGLGLLPVRTTFGREKRTETVRVVFATLAEPWRALTGLPLRGYEIRHGETAATGGVDLALPGERGFVAGSVLGVSIHGLFENPDVASALLGARPRRPLEAVFDGLADLVEERLDMDELARLAGVA
jgi:adenosylcobyric acid synthase